MPKSFVISLTQKSIIKILPVVRTLYMSKILCWFNRYLDYKEFGLVRRGLHNILFEFFEKAGILRPNSQMDWDLQCKTNDIK